MHKIFCLVCQREFMVSATAAANLLAALGTVDAQTKLVGIIVDPVNANQVLALRQTDTEHLRHIAIRLLRAKFDLAQTDALQLAPLLAKAA